MLNSSIQTQTAQQTQTTYYEKASQFARSCAKAPVSITKNCLIITAKSTALALGSLAVTTLIQVDTSYNNRDYAISSYMPDWTIAPIRSFTSSVGKVSNLAQSFFNYTVNLGVGFDLSPTEIFYSAAVEELLFREIVQNQFLPTIARFLPEKVGFVINHSITRVAVTSILFAIAHQSSWGYQIGVMPQLFSGILLGTVREITGSNVLPILSHALENLIIIGSGG